MLHRRTLGHAVRRALLVCALLVSGCTPAGVVPPETDRAARAALDSLRPDTVQLVGYTVFRSFKRDFQQWTLDYQLHNPTGWSAARVSVAASGGNRQVGGVRVVPEPESLAQSRALTWANATPAGLLALFAGLNLVAFCVVTAILIIRTPMPRRWLYALGSIIGIGALRVPGARAWSARANGPCSSSAWAWRT